MAQTYSILTADWTNAPASCIITQSRLNSTGLCYYSNMTSIIDPDSSKYVYLCPYCESIYDEYQSNCKNCGAPLMLKPIRRCE